MNAFRTLILPAVVAPLAREMAAKLSPAGADMWTVGLSPNGAAPATHFISTGYISEDFAHMLPCRDSGATGSPIAVHQACTAAGMQITLAQIESVFAAADVTEQSPFEAMNRIGLKLVADSNI